MLEPCLLQPCFHVAGSGGLSTLRGWDFQEVQTQRLLVLFYCYFRYLTFFDIYIYIERERERY